MSRASGQTKGNEIASALALAMVHEEVKNAVQAKGYAIALKPSSESHTAEVTVQNDGTEISVFTATRIAKKMGSQLTKVKEVGVTGGASDGPKNIKLSISLQNEGIGNEHAMSPFLMFPIGSAIKDFLYPGVLPFAFLDTDLAALVNYLTPLFFMTGALITVFIDSIFEESGFAANLGYLSRFKNWSAGSEPGWHAVWLLNVPKYMAFLLAMWCIHGTFGRLRCIVQSRWRVMLLTMFVVIPRAWLETAGYVGVANYGLARAAVMTKSGQRQGTGKWPRTPGGEAVKDWGGPDAPDFSGFTMIMVHDLLAMFCRFVYGKFAVDYN